MTKTPVPGSPIDLAIRASGSVSKLAASLGVSQQAVSKWKSENRIPFARIESVSKATGIPARLLLPESFAKAVSPSE